MRNQMSMNCVYFFLGKFWVYAIWKFDFEKIMKTTIFYWKFGGFVFNKFTKENKFNKSNKKIFFLSFRA